MAAPATPPSAAPQTGAAAMPSWCGRSAAASPGNGDDGCGDRRDPCRVAHQPSQRLLTLGPCIGCGHQLRMLLDEVGRVVAFTKVRFREHREVVRNVRPDADDDVL